MRPGELLLIAALIAVAASGCSRLTFVRPKGGITEFDAPRSEYRVSDSKATRQRLEEQDSLGLAEQRLRVGDLNTAEQEASKVLKRNPASVGALTLLAIVADRRGQSKAAGEYYRKAAELAPNDGGMLNNYGAWLCGNGFAAEALVWFDRAIATPNYNPAGALANAGGCALQTGQYERAEADLRKPGIGPDQCLCPAVDGTLQVQAGPVHGRARLHRAQDCGCTGRPGRVTTGSRHRDQARRQGSRREISTAAAGGVPRCPCGKLWG